MRSLFSFPRQQSISKLHVSCLASELTGSIIHERVDSINYGEQVTSSTVNSLVRWQIKQFTNHTLFSYSRFKKQLQPEAKKQSY